MFEALSISPAMRQSARSEAGRLHARHGAEAMRIVEERLAVSSLSFHHRAFLKAVRGHLKAMI